MVKSSLTLPIKWQWPTLPIKWQCIPDAPVDFLPGRGWNSTMEFLPSSGEFENGEEFRPRSACHDHSGMEAVISHGGFNIICKGNIPVSYSFLQFSFVHCKTTQQMVLATFVVTSCIYYGVKLLQILPYWGFVLQACCLPWWPVPAVIKVINSNC